MIFFTEMYQICMFFASHNVKSLHPHPECKIEKRDRREKLRNGHGNVMEKYFVKSVGTLVINDLHTVHMQNMYFCRKRACPPHSQTDKYRRVFLDRDHAVFV